MALFKIVVWAIIFLTNNHIHAAYKMTSILCNNRHLIDCYIPFYFNDQSDVITRWIMPEPFVSRPTGLRAQSTRLQLIDVAYSHLQVI